MAAYIGRRGGPRYDGRREIVITSGEGDAMLDALFCLTDPGDEAILTDPTYAGMLNRVRLVRGDSRSSTCRVRRTHVVCCRWLAQLAIQGSAVWAYWLGASPGCRPCL